MLYNLTFMKEHPAVLISIANWNGGEEVIDCLSSLRKLDYANFRVVVVDNDSQDGSPQKIEEAFPEITLIRNDRNEGYTRANNRVLQLALEEGVDFVLLLNNDTIADAAFLRLLVEEAMRREETVLLGPKICYHPSRERTWSVGGKFVFGPNLTALIGHQKGDRFQGASSFFVDFLPGCALLIKREILEHVGLLDEDYFAYMEDVDFCLRAKRAGYKCLVVPQAQIYHRASLSTGGDYSPGRKYLQALNTVLFLRKNGGRLLDWAGLFLFDILFLPLAYLRAIFQGKGRSVRAKALGIWDGLMGKRVKEWLAPGEVFSRKGIKFF